MSRERYFTCLTEVQNALLQEWDPIGVKDIPEASREYHSYAPMITNMILSGKNKMDIFEFLWELETEHMGLNGNREATNKFTDRLIEFQNQFLEDNN